MHRDGAPEPMVAPRPIPLHHRAKREPFLLSTSRSASNWRDSPIEGCAQTNKDPTVRDGRPARRAQRPGPAGLQPNPASDRGRTSWAPSSPMRSRRGVIGFQDSVALAKERREAVYWPDRAAMLFWALLASGQIVMRKVDGWQPLANQAQLISPREAVKSAHLRHRYPKFQHELRPQPVDSVDITLPRRYRGACVK